MLRFKDMVIVLKTNKTQTSIIDELKRAYDASLNLMENKGLPEIVADHRILYESLITDNDNAKVSIIIDGTTLLESENSWGGTSKYYENSKLPDYCKFCDTYPSTQRPPYLVAEKPIIVIHVKHLSTDWNTCFCDILDYSLRTLAKLRYVPITSTPIKQMIITIDQRIGKTAGELNHIYKIVADGQVIYNGRIQERYFENTEEVICDYCLKNDSRFSSK